MKTLTLKTIGASPSYPADSIELDSKKIADYIWSNMFGGQATQKQADQLTQEFVDKYEIKAIYASGTLMGFRIPSKHEDACDDEFETFERY